MATKPPFGIVQTDSGWNVTLKGEVYRPFEDRTWSSRLGAEAEANAMNSIWLIGYEDGAEMAMSHIATGAIT